MAPLTKKRRAIVEDPESEEDVSSEAEASRSAQRRRRRAPVDSDSGDASDAGNGEDVEMDGTGANGSSDQSQLVKKFVRYALACEYARLPIRRDGVRDKVFGKNKAPWKKIFDATQQQLQSKFGMEMQELPLKEKVTLKDRLAASKSQTAPTSSRSYILTSTLPAAYRSASILPPCPIPTTSTESSYIGLYTLIITVISLSGGKLPDAKLDRYLRRLNADINMPMDKTEAVLTKMIKQGYLIRLKDNVGGEEIIEWMAGPRGKVEVGNGGVMGLVTQVYGDNAPDDLSDRIQSSLGLDAPKQEPNVQGASERGGRGHTGARSSGRRRKDEEDDD